MKPVCLYLFNLVQDLWLTHRISLHLPVAARRQCEVELEVEVEAELAAVERLRQSIRVYQLVLLEVLVQLAVRLSCSNHS